MLRDAGSEGPGLQPASQDLKTSRPQDLKSPRPQDLKSSLDIEFFRFLRPFHDEAETGRGVLAHQLVDHPIRHDLI